MRTSKFITALFISFLVILLAAFTTSHAQEMFQLGVTKHDWKESLLKYSMEDQQTILDQFTWKWDSKGTAVEISQSSVQITMDRCVKAVQAFTDLYVLEGTKVLHQDIMDPNRSTFDPPICIRIYELSDGTYSSIWYDALPTGGKITRTFSYKIPTIN
jgi:hypothetical protein